jgi:3-oxoacyl-[acyl-carrier protein] reductase
MARDLKGNVALVTGASRGIGRSTSIALAESGAHVVMSARSGGQLDSVKAEIEGRGGSATVVPADLAAEVDIDSLFRKVKTQFGRLDILVNNAGIGLWGKLVDFPILDFDRLVAVNVRGMYLCCQQALRLMIPARRGFIFNISSVVGFKGYPKQSAYTATKHAVMGLTKSLAVEVQEHNVHVSAILPGGVDTGFIGDARPDLDRSVLMPPEDIANTILYMLSLSDRAWVDEIYIRRRTGTPFI